MSEEEVISISDSESSRHSLVLLEVASKQPQQHTHKTPEANQNKVITISSQSNQSFERCPVTWNNAPAKKTPFKYLHSESFLSPSPRTKVSGWLYENCQGNSDVDTKNTSRAYTDNKSAIQIRQDYRKPYVTNSPTPPCLATYLRRSSCTQESNLDQNGTICITSRGSSVASEIIQSTSSKESEKQRTLESLDCSSKITTPNNTKITSNQRKNQVTTPCDTLSDTLSTKVDENKSINSPADLEVPNKIELCEYLKLMNMKPVDGKVIGSKQNRRSSRVKNLAVMSEKRALERELNTDGQNDEKKKTTNGVDHDVKSCNGSESSKESRGSSKASNGANLSTTTEKTNDKKNLPMRKLGDEKNKIGKILGIPDSIRTKYLQVPEVSTTSTSKVIAMPDKVIQKERETKQNRRTNTNNKNGQVKDSTDGRKSVIMTKKSFTQLNININMMKTSKDQRKLPIIKDSLLNYMTGITRTDFEDSFNEAISTEDINKHLQKKKKSALNNSKNQRTKTPLSKNNFDSKQSSKEITKKEPKRKLKMLDRFPKSRLRQIHEKLKIKRSLRAKQIKKTQTFRLYSRRTNLTKLRSRGRLREIKMKSVLLDHEKKKRRKRFTAKATQVTPKRREKEFRKTVLIQRNMSAEEPVESAKKCDVSQPQAEFSPLKILKLKSEIELLKNLTPEHRKALFESKKFLIMKSKMNAKTADTAIELESKQDKANEDNKMDVENVQKVDKTTETTEDCDSTFTLPKLVHVAQQTQPNSEFNRPTSEDLEVHKLMRSSYLKDQILQEKSKSVEVTPLIKNALDVDLKENCRSSSSSKSSSSSNLSLQTVESNHEPTRSSINEDADVYSKTHSYENENPINEEIVETSNFMPDNETEEEEEEDDCDNQPEVVDISDIERTKVDCIHLVDDQETTIKLLHQCLTQRRKKQIDESKQGRRDQEWDERFNNTPRSSRSERKTNQSYAIELSSSNGAVMNAYYLDYNLVIVQEFLVSFWNQTSLGNVLGAQDMWMPKGDTKRIVLGNGCSQKESAESVVVSDNSIAYVELWTKEHKSDKRERPVADIFVTIYLRLNGSRPDKKVLQLENIHGYANDVQFIVLKNSPYIIVSWNTVSDQLTSTVVHKYQLSSDYQTLNNIVALQPAAHYIASLHNIEDSDTLIMGCGEDKITLWHVEDGYIIATMDLMAIAQQPRTLWAKADRGFIFTLHNFNDGYFHLIATNSFDYSWKQLQVYKQEGEYENLLGICIENGLVIAFYDTGILCWSAKSGELITDSPCESSMFLPFGKHIVVIIENQVHVRHVLEYLVTIDDS